MCNVGMIRTSGSGSPKNPSPPIRRCLLAFLTALSISMSGSSERRWSRGGSGPASLCSSLISVSVSASASVSVSVTFDSWSWSTGMPSVLGAESESSDSGTDIRLLRTVRSWTGGCHGGRV